MRKLIVFNQVSVDGFFCDAAGDMSWAHQSDPEWLAFVEGNAASGGELVFGRITYRMMASYWPSATAKKANPEVAKRMNGLPKVVFSHSLTSADWAHTRLRKGDLGKKVAQLKAEAGPQMVIFGSGSLVAGLAPLGLIDEYQIVVIPTVLGGGRSMFEGIGGRLDLTLVSSRAFGNGNVLLSYRPAT